MSYPSDWSPSKVKYIGTYKNGYPFKPAEWTDSGKPIIRIQNLTDPTAPFNYYQAELPIEYEVVKGDLLIAWSASLGAYEWWGEPAWLNQHIFKVALDESKVARPYFKWLATWFMNELNSAKHGSTMQHVTWDTFGPFPLRLPSLKEQRRIAGYLDEETARIDALVMAKQDMLALLEKKRAALVSQAVTKGLDPTVKMKDSGMEWLGEIPEHWEVRPLRYWGWCQNGVSQSGDYFGSGHPFVNYGDVYKNEALPETVEGLANSTEEDQLHYSVEEGDVFFTRTSETIEEIGIASTCLKTIKRAIFSGFVIRVRPFKRTVKPEFSKYYFRSNALRVFFMQEMNIITRASMSQDLLKRLPVLIPPVSEQKHIAKYLDEQCRDLRTLSEELEASITLLNRRRGALITAAVTGQARL